MSVNNLCAATNILIPEAVLAARQLNANVLWELQQRLENMNNSIAALDEKAQELEKENAVL